jgi:tRNA (mo5U34)-methyltransferase
MRASDGSVGGDADFRQPPEEFLISNMDRIKNFILQKVPPIHRIVSERDQLIKERNLLLHKSRSLEFLLTEENEATRNAAAEPKKRISRILTEREVKYYKEKIEEYGKGVGWFHSLELGNGLSTSGSATKEALNRKIRCLRIPDDLTGMTVLDVGSWDGYFAFEADARGASRVLATDYFCWGGRGWGKKEGFLLAREILGSKVEDKTIEVDDLSPTTVGMWDIVLFFGIFYHLRDPIKAMQAAASVASKSMIVETCIVNDEMSEPIMRYVPRKPGEETSNYWRPNSAMILLLLNEMGFSRVEHRVVMDPPGGLDCTHGFFNAYR